MPETSKMDRNLALEAVRVTEAAALSASRLMGRGDEKAADQAAVDAMREALNSLAIDGTVVIGEGERDEAPMLYIGEKVGSGNGPPIDIALDPLEGTTITAKGGANALAVIAMADAGGFLNAPDVYMDKIAVGGGLPDDLVDLDEPPSVNLKNLAQAKKVEVADLVVCILDRPRHAELIAKVREAGARITLISDGDVSGVIATSEPETGDRHVCRLGRRAGRRVGGRGAALHRRADARPAAVPQRRRARPRPSPRHRRPRSQIQTARPRLGRRDVCGDRGHQWHDAARGAPLSRRRRDAFGRHALEIRHRPLRRGTARLHAQAELLTLRPLSLLAVILIQSSDLVIPAQAGIQGRQALAWRALDPRFREGDDRGIMGID